MADFIRQGKNTFAKHVIAADPAIMAGDEVMVVNGNDELLATGSAVLSGAEMLRFNYGVAVSTTGKVRRTFVVPRPGLLQVDVKFVPYLLQGRRLYQFTAIDCCTRLRVIQFHEEMATYTAKTFIQYALVTFPFPIRIVQTDNDSIFTHWYTAGPKTPLTRRSKNTPSPLCVNASRPNTASSLLGPLASMERSKEVIKPMKKNSIAFARWLWHYNYTRPHMGLNG